MLGTLPETRDKDQIFIFSYTILFRAPLTLGPVMWLASGQWTGGKRDIVPAFSPLPLEQHAPESGCSTSLVLRIRTGRDDLNAHCGLGPSPAKPMWAQQTHTHSTDPWVSNKCLLWTTEILNLPTATAEAGRYIYIMYYFMFLSYACCWILDMLEINQFSLSSELRPFWFFSASWSLSRTFKRLHCNLLLWIQALLDPQRPGN